jgi:hypothetical protein
MSQFLKIISQKYKRMTTCKNANDWIQSHENGQGLYRGKSLFMSLNKKPRKLAGIGFWTPCLACTFVEFPHLLAKFVLYPSIFCVLTSP